VTMFRTRYRSTWKRKNKRRPVALTALMLLVGVPIGLELLVRLVTSMTGFDPESVSQSAQAQKVQAYQLKFLSPSGQPYATLPSNGTLAVTRNPLMGYQLVPQQKNQFWTINPQGFRDTEPVSPAKPEGEVRIFVLGGSTAFGQLSSSNQATFADQLEKLFNDQVAGQQSTPARYQPAVLPYLAEDVDKALALPSRIPDRKYRVINAAVPGYASGNELAMLMQQITDYSPDMVIVLNSYADLTLPSTQSGADIPGLDEVLQGKTKDVGTQISETVKGWLNELYLVQGFQRFILRSPQPNDNLGIMLNLMTASPSTTISQALPADAAELDRRVDRYRDHMLQMARWSSATKKRLFIGVQPDISSRQQMTLEEQAIATQLGAGYNEKVKAGHAKLVAAANQAVKASANVQLLDLQSLYAKSARPMFQSTTSLTDEANQELAKQFYRTIGKTLAIEPKPFGS
jgi:hypothetical protein